MPPDAKADDSSPDTVTEALRQLAADGYDADFRLRDRGVFCPVCGQEPPFHSAIVDRIYRFEGQSDPGDEFIVFGLRCGNCGARGSLASGYGTAADPEVLDHLNYLADHAEHD